MPHQGPALQGSNLVAKKTAGQDKVVAVEELNEFRPSGPSSRTPLPGLRLGPLLDLAESPWTGIGWLLFESVSGNILQ